MARVSVILTVYNRTQYLAFAIKSIINQPFKDFELIVLNNGSNEDTTYKIKK